MPRLEPAPFTAHVSSVHLSRRLQAIQDVIATLGCRLALGEVGLTYQASHFKEGLVHK